MNSRWMMLFLRGFWSLSLFLSGRNVGVVVAQEATPAWAAVFKTDEGILANNVAEIARKSENLPSEERYALLRSWVLPSQNRFTFRMSAEFLPTDPSINDKVPPPTAVCDQILSPVFALLQVAQATGQIDSLREQIEQISPAKDSYQVRSRLALLVMIDMLRDDTSRTTESITSLIEQIRQREDHAGYRWWPETLAMAWGMAHAPERPEVMDLVSSIYSPQITNSRWSNHRALDTYVAGCFARVLLEHDQRREPAVDDKSAFESWRPASVMTMFSRGTGVPAAQWENSRGEIRKIVGHDSDYLYFPTPLIGDFEVAAQMSGFNYRENQLSYGGMYSSHYWTLEDFESGTIHNRDRQLIPIQPPMTKAEDRLVSRIATKEGVSLHSINGRSVREASIRQEQFPWLAVRADRLTRGQVSQLTITGHPDIPRTVSLLTSPSLMGWFSHFEEPVAEEGRGDAWMLASGANGHELVHPINHQLTGTWAESLLLYHRPWMEDGSIAYEFYYKPGVEIVHPAVDRRVFLITPQGVRTHWMTDSLYSTSEAAPDNATSVLSGRPLHDVLKPDAWNRLTFELAGSLVTITINDAQALQVTCDDVRHRQFGLFHYSDQSTARVRNMHWTGQWSVPFKSPFFPPQQLTEVQMIDQQLEKLPRAFQYDFRKGLLRPDRFSPKGAGFRDTPEGLAACVNGNSNSAQTDLAVQMDIGGDFDLRASFRSFAPSARGFAGLALALTLDGSGHQIRLERDQWSNGEQHLKAQWGKFGPNGRMEYSDTWSVFEGRAGTLRIARVGQKIHWMVAEYGSERYHLLRSETVGTDNLRQGETVLSLLAQTDATAECLWIGTVIRAERMTESASKTSYLKDVPAPTASGEK